MLTFSWHKKKVEGSLNPNSKIANLSNKRVTSISVTAAATTATTPPRLQPGLLLETTGPHTANLMPPFE